METYREKKLIDRVVSARGVHEKNIVITGASSGVGRAAALAFASKGATIVLAARRNDALEDVVAECHRLGARAVAIPTDVSDAAEVKQLAAAAVAYCNSIDVWINNAGVLAAGEFSDTPVEITDRVIEINLLGYIHGAHAVLPYFKKQGYGILINNISIGAWLPTPYATGYTASKFGIKGFTEALRGELREQRDIHICDLFPAFLDTPGLYHAANYTGKVLMPAPPVFDPKRVADAMVILADAPRNYTTTDLIAPFIKFAYSMFPRLSRRITAAIMETYFKKAKRIEHTEGNLFKPVSFGTGVYGGWKLRLSPRTATVTTFFLGVAATGILFLAALRK